MIQPHVKLIKLSKMKSYKEKMDFIRYHKDDELFIQLLILLLSPEYKFNTERKLMYDLKPMVTAPTKQTFGKFRTLLYKMETNKDYEYVLEDYLSNYVDIPTAYAYALVANREYIGISFIDIVSLIGKEAVINNNEYYLDFGFPEFPCYIQEIDESNVRVNVSYTFGVATLTTLDGRRLVNSIELQEELDSIYVSDSYWLSGYFEDDIFYVSDYYFNDSVKFSERFIELEKLLAFKEFKYIKIIKTYKIHNLHEFQYIVKNISTPNLLCRYDTPPNFGKESSKNIMLSTEKLRKL